MHSPLEPHMEAFKRILLHLKATLGKGLLFSQNGHMDVEAYTNVDWDGSMTNERSIFGYCTLVEGNLVTCRSQRQLVVARWSAEVEYRVMTLGICELIWIKNLLRELQIESKGPMKLYCDNKANYKHWTQPSLSWYNKTYWDK